MKRSMLVVLAITLLTVVPAPARQADKSSTEKPFQSGGKIWMELSAGDYDIRGGSDDRLIVRWRGHRYDDDRVMRVAIRTEGSQAWIETADAKRHSKVTIEVPARSDINVKMSAGDLRIAGIEGNKDVSLLAGDLDIDIGRASDYGRLDASVKVGDLNARPFNMSTGGLWRSFRWQGTGRYTLNVSLLAGDLTLTEGR